MRFCRFVVTHDDTILADEYYGPEGGVLPTMNQLILSDSRCLLNLERKYCARRFRLGPLIDQDMVVFYSKYAFYVVYWQDCLQQNVSFLRHSCFVSTSCVYSISQGTVLDRDLHVHSRDWSSFTFKKDDMLHHVDVRKRPFVENVLVQACGSVLYTVLIQEVATFVGFVKNMN